MSLRRLLPLLVLVALVLAPFGRMGVAEAKAMPRHAVSAMTAHCPDMPLPDGGGDNGMTIDCMMACATMAAAAAPLVPPPQAEEAVVTALPFTFFPGIRPEAEPPPPRFS